MSFPVLAGRVLLVPTPSDPGVISSRPESGFVTAVGPERLVSPAGSGTAVDDMEVTDVVWAEFLVADMSDQG